MRKVIVSEFVSLDGVMEDPQWSGKYWSDEIAKFKYDELFSIDALLLGRVTYEGFAQAWPGRTDEQGYAERINSIPKHVVTTTLKSLDWNNSHAISANVVEEINKLKQQPGQDILVFGSSTLVQYLIANDLVDQYNLLVYPVVIGGGKRVFKEGTKTTLTLIDCKPFSSGAIAQVYQTAKE